MAVNLDAIRKRLGKLQNTNKSAVELWKPTPGKYQIRIVPYKFSPENPFIELYFHYNINNKTYLSPATYGRPDPFVEFANRLKRTGDKEDWKSGRSMEPKMRVYVPVVVRGEEAQGVRFWGMSKTVYQEILGYMADDDYGDITDVQEGFDVSVHIMSPEESGKTWATTTLRVKPRPSPLAESQEQITKFLENQRDISDLFEEPSYQELYQVLQDWLNPVGDESADADDEVLPPAPATSSSPPFVPDPPKSPVSGVTPASTSQVGKSSNNTADIRSKFDSLFNS
jgi:hypothetical protein